MKKALYTFALSALLILTSAASVFADIAPLPEPEPEPEPTMTIFRVLLVIGCIILFALLLWMYLKKRKSGK